MKQLNTIQSNIMRLYKADPNTVNDDALLIARYWYKFDKWEDIQGSLYDKLKTATSGDSITRARRWLHEHDYIKYDKQVDEIRYQKFVETTNEYGEKVMIQRRMT